MSPSVAHQAAAAAHDAALARGATRGEASRRFYVAREAAHGRPDAEERGHLVGQIAVAGLMRGLEQDAHEAACGLPEGALLAGTASMAELRAALDRLSGGAS